VGDPGASYAVGEEEFAAPRPAILAITVPIEGDAENLSSRRDPVLKQYSEHVGVMMLDLEMGKAEFFGVARRPEMGMEVGNDDLGPDIEQALEVGDRLFEIPEVPVLIEVAQELAGDDEAVLIERNCILELSAERENVPG
jgi:hypothetical protein